jgi:hypothetical protein
MSRFVYFLSFYTALAQPVIQLDPWGMHSIRIRIAPQGQQVRNPTAY